MKEQEQEAIATSTSTSTGTKRENSSNISNGDHGGVGGVAMMKGHYKFLWVLAAIVLLALWSMFTGSVTLKWSASNLTRFSRDLDEHSRTLQDLDVLEVEEREKVVRRMWDVYSHSATARLPRFWSDAFHAAYEHLVSDVPAVRDSAISEIAKMSLHSLDFQQQLYPRVQSESNIRGSRKMKQEERSLGTTTGTNQ